MKLLTSKSLLFVIAFSVGAMAAGQATGAPKPLPVIIISANDATSGAMQPGVPLIVGALSTVEEGDAPNLPATLKIKLADGKGTNVVLALTRIVRAKETTQFYWAATESVTANLKPGRYDISIDESGGKLTGWTLEGCDLTVDPSDDTNGDLKSELNIELLLLQDKSDDAIKVATALTEKDPKNINAWVALGDIYMAANMPAKALDAYQSALANFKDDGNEPLSILQRYRDALQREMGDLFAPAH